MRVSLQPELKPNNYTETCMIDVVPRETCVERFERGSHCTSKSKAVLNAQESAKVIVAER